MSKAKEMAHVFMVRHPEDAAKILSHVSHIEATSLLAQTSAEVSATILEQMTPFAAAQCLEACDDQDAARLILAMVEQSAKIVLSHLPSEQRKRVIQLLPKTKAMAIRQLLEHPEDTVGARVDNQVAALSETDTVGQALYLLRTNVRLYGSATFVVSTDQRLVGHVTIGKLLAHPRDTRLSMLATPCPRILSSLTTLASVIDLQEWETHDVLPVVDRAQRFSGILHHAALIRRAGGNKPTKRSSVAIGPLLVDMASACIQGASAVIMALVPARTEEEAHPSQRNSREP